MNQFEIDVNKRVMEKLAEHFARPLIRKMGDKFTVQDYIKLHNKVYVPKLSYAEEKIRDRIAGGYYSARAKDNEVLSKQYKTLLKNFDTMHSPQYSKPRLSSRDFNIDTKAVPAKHLLGFIEELSSKKVKQRLQRVKSDSLSNVIKQKGGKNPIMKGLSGLNPVSNIEHIENGMPTYVTSDNRVLSNFNFSTDKTVEELRQKLTEVTQKLKEEGLSHEAVKGAPVSFFTGYPNVAGAYSFGNNISVGNLNKIVADMKNRGMDIFSGNMGSFNPKYRKRFRELAQELTGAKSLSNNSGTDPDLWRKHETLIPGDLINKLNPSAYHVYDPVDRNFNMINLWNRSRKAENASNLKNWRNSRRAKSLKAIPLEDYVSGNNFFNDTILNSENAKALGLDLQRYGTPREFAALVGALPTSDWFNPYM